jgi:hypothetical protein
MQPLNMAANQVLGKAQQGGQPQPGAAAKEPTGQQKSALQKLSGMYNTPIQAREQEKNNV